MPPDCDSVLTFSDETLLKSLLHLCGSRCGSLLTYVSFLLDDRFVSGIHVQLVFHYGGINTGHLLGAEDEDVPILL